MIAKVARADAEVFAKWFKALSDPTRIQVLNLIATSGRELAVGEVVDELPVAQSTVSHHLRILAETRFVLVRAEGNANYYRFNALCMEEFPSAAELIIGRRRSATAKRSQPRRPGA